MAAPFSWPAFVEATDRLREATDALARLVADTLAVQFDGAAAYFPSRSHTPRNTAL
ncbi:hypothetical protein [Streptomyces sp. NBC_01483]|uniref:hypothetical protein n=1 Tax=Streptomyces sp. NBC_01483 TaxID=2903883 RepID=UPI002E300DEA|nr:hypothetical protein [Streptomyces sp. NBC_01483]